MDGFHGLIGDNMNRCLLIDPDPLACAALSRYLKRFAYTVKSGSSAQDLKRLALAEPFDIILMDMAVTGMTGLDLCRWVSESLQVPLIVMTAQSEPDSHVAALEAGADDFIDKPLEPREVVARIRAVLRRMNKDATERSSHRGDARNVAFAGWRLDLLTRELTSSQGAAAVLSVAEFRLLCALIAQPGQVIARAKLAGRLFLQGESEGLDGDVRAVDLAVSRLRRKLGDTPPRANLIRTIRGEGYLLDAVVESS